MNLTLEDYERIHPHMAYTVQPWPPGDSRASQPPSIKFFTPNRHCAWRVETLDTKEPDTIAWLAKMKPGEVLYDVGANMGQYALIAAARGLSVHAFEPESQNFALLMRNIMLNNMGDVVTAWPLCLSFDETFGRFHVQSLQAGGSCSSFNAEVNFHLQPKSYPVHQGSFAVRMDEFANVGTRRFWEKDTHAPWPDHVKIDVDGLEHNVIAGMGVLLTHIKSVLVELNTALPEHLAIIDTMKASGLEPDLETADAARRTEGAFAGIGNIIFYRSQA
jgi:FkbM family methyltransferase